jgi:Zn2+/Cd2+-exporting ATPase
MKPPPTSLRTETHSPSSGRGSTCCAPRAPTRGDALRTASARDGLLLRIPAMDCPAEESEIRRAVEHIQAIGGLRFDLSARTLRIDAPDDALPTILDAIREAGFSSLPIEPDAPADRGLDGIPRGIAVLATALVLALGAELLAYLMPDMLLANIAGMGLAAMAITMAGFSTYSKGLAALSSGRLNINALMSVAVTGAFAIGQWPEAAMVMALYAIAELIEARSVDRARNAIKSLLALTPETAEVRQADGSWHALASRDVMLAAVVRVKPGARIPLDGVVTAGSSAVNQAPVTGESLPVDKTIGDTVFAGTINESGLLEFRVTARSSETTLARIIHTVETAQGSKAPMQRFVDRFAAFYTPAVFVIALAVALLTPWLLGWSWSQSLYKALVLLVIACPCALVIATPVTVVSGLASAARRGILIKGGVYLEDARKLKVIALDKTGTITEGKPKLVATEILDQTISQKEILEWASSLATLSDHPVSKAISTGLAPTLVVADHFQALSGRGVQGRIGNQDLILGNHRLIEERKLCSAAIEARLVEHEAQGRTMTLLANGSGVLAIFAVADTIKPHAREAISALHALGIKTVMLSGDNQATAGAIATQAGVDDARGNLLPEDKLDAIEALQKEYGPTAMTGDGINDAPALARADIGVAMGAAGTDTAMEAADIVIMNDDLRRIPEAIRLSRTTHQVLWQNIVLALGIKAVVLVLALLGSASMWMAVFADMGASLLVVGNGLRLLRLGQPNDQPSKVHV